MAYTVVFNLIFGLTAPLVWLTAPPIAALLFVAPEWAETPATLHSDHIDNGGIPFYYYNNEFDVAGRLLNPFQWVPTALELLIDYLHVLSYLFVYWQEYFSTDKYTFPEIKYSERTGREIAGDMVQMYGWLYTL